MLLLQRHPRFTLALIITLLVSLLLLASQNSSLGGPSFGGPPPVAVVESHGEVKSLGARLNQAEEIYQRMLWARKGLIKKFGPTEEEIDMFPPDHPPYPPYTVWDFFPAAFNCPHEVERIGALGDGGKWVCGLSRIAYKPSCVIYSFGINKESSFEAELLSRTQGCEVWGYDFSVDSFGPEIPSSLLPRAHFYPYGLAGEDAHGPHDEKKMYTLATLMRMNGHSHIDILKIDIESWEFQTLTSLIASYRASGQPLPFSQLQLEIHAWNLKFPTFLKWWEDLEAMGLRPFWTEPNEVYANYNRGGTPDLAEYSFINIKGSHELITDRRGHRNHD